MRHLDRLAPVIAAPRRRAPSTVGSLQRRAGPKLDKMDAFRYHCIDCYGLHNPPG